MAFNQPTDTDRYLAQMGFTGLSLTEADNLPPQQTSSPIPDSSDLPAEVSAQAVEEVLNAFRLIDDV